MNDYLALAVIIIGISHVESPVHVSGRSEMPAAKWGKQAVGHIGAATIVNRTDAIFADAAARIG